MERKSYAVMSVGSATAPAGSSMELEGLEKSIFAYLFLVADEKLTTEKLFLFNELRTGNSELDAKRNDLILACRRMTGEDFNKYNGEKRFKLIFKTIKSIEEELYGSWSDNPMTVQLECFWILTNLGCYGSISNNQKQILALLAEKWKIPNLVQMEMKDTAETLAEIESQRKWLFEPKKKYSGRYRKKVIAELDKNEADMNQSIAYLVHDTAQDAEYGNNSANNTDTEEDAKSKNKLVRLVGEIEKSGVLKGPFYLWVFISKIELDDEYSSEKEKKLAVKKAWKEAMSEVPFLKKIGALLLLRIIHILLMVIVFFLKIPLWIGRFFIWLKDRFLSLFQLIGRGIKKRFMSSKKKTSPYDYLLSLEEVQEEDDDADEDKEITLISKRRNK
jgi:hypothetical protein